MKRKGSEFVNIIEVAYSWNKELENRTDTQFIVIHHAKAKTCSVQDIDAWHKNNGWAGIGYHFFLRKDGIIYRGRPQHTQGAHAKGYNHNSIGICLEGDFSVEEPTQAQEASLIELARYLISIYPKVRVVRHKDLNDTECPGANFPNRILLEAMNPPTETVEHWAEESFNYLNGKGIEVKERRFDNASTRGECIVLMARLHKALKG